MRKERSTLSLITDVLRLISSLVQKEIRLAKAELSENISRAGAAIGLLVGAAILGMVALNLIAGTLVAALASAGVSVVWATLIVASFFGVIALIMVLKAQSDLKMASRAPSRAADRIRRDANALKEATHDK
ncbi:phage holin family protein [Aliiroseovarius sediminis]|uniref:phage holin family protein n=1 Tax=Aliiroseovarius sediminis TaxID=2925839 RepID=UPI001F58577D|nr:phage holin family protein [Aliiroseovarius sediminis]MCI2394025.1 phage holin family protein [Aliiroseovarius sediminis]